MGNMNWAFHSSRYYSNLRVAVFLKIESRSNVRCFSKQRRWKCAPGCWNDIWQTFYTMVSLCYREQLYRVEIVSKCGSYFTWWFDVGNDLQALTIRSFKIVFRQMFLTKLILDFFFEKDVEKSLHEYFPVSYKILSIYVVGYLMNGHFVLKRLKRVSFTWVERKAPH